MKKARDWLADTFKDGGKSGLTVILVLLAAGALVTLIGKTFGTESGKPSGIAVAYESAAAEQSKPAAREYETALENRLAELLSAVYGAGKVDVMITVGETSEVIFAKDKTSDSSQTSEDDGAGGKREQSSRKESEQTVYAKSGDPAAVKSASPKITGALIVAEGGGEAAVREELTRAAANALGVEIHKITVARRAPQGANSNGIKN